MTTTSAPSATFDGTADLAAILRERCRGAVSAPGDADYDSRRAAWNLAVDQRPAAVVVAADAEDVVATVRTAAGAGLRVAPQATGHAAAPLGDLSRTVLLRTGELRDVSIDPATRIVRAGAGAQWQDVVPRAAELGLAVLHGSAPDVGVVGYTLGGGLSWYGRRLGLAANHVTAFDVVTADGEARRVDAQTAPEVFWALRGGGGSSAIVTAIEFRAFPITSVHCGWLVWPWEQAAEVLPAWQAWTQQLPDTVTSVGRILQLPPFADVPPGFPGRRLVVVEAAMLEDAATADALLAPLRALGPATDTFATVPVTELPALHRDPPVAVPFAGDHAVLDRLTADAIAALVEVAGPGSDSRLLSVEVRHLGGALGRPAEGGGARSHIQGEYLAFAVGVTPTPTDHNVVAAQAERVVSVLGPWRNPVGFANFNDNPAGGPVHDAGTSERLRAVKHGVDPTSLVHANLDPAAIG